MKNHMRFWFVYCEKDIDAVDNFNGYNMYPFRENDTSLRGIIGMETKRNVRLSAVKRRQVIFLDDKRVRNCFQTDSNSQDISLIA